jgi:urea transport system substrate-binding protein
VAKIVGAKPDAIVNTIDGSSNFSLFKKLRAAGLTSDKVASVSVSITESELRGIGYDVMAGHYLTANYFQSMDRPEARLFRERIHAKYGKDQTVSHLMGAAYTSVKLWVQAVVKADSHDPAKVANAVKGMEIEGVAGRIRIDPETMHTWRPWRLGRVRGNGTIEVVAEKGADVRPVPFPSTRRHPTRDHWNGFLDNLFTKWGGSWEERPTRKPQDE